MRARRSVLTALLGAAALVLSLPAMATRVVALAPHLAELVCAAGACDQLVGRVDYSDYPPQIHKLPLVGDAFTLNAEALLALEPELVITWDGGTPVATVSQVQRLGIDHLAIRVNALDDVATALLQLGQRLGTQQPARAAADRYQKRIAELRERYRDVRRLRVFYQIEADPIFTINGDSPISQALALCGGDNVFADLPRLSGSLSQEAVLARNPDVVIWGKQDDNAGIEAFWHRWPDAKATRGGHLYAIDADTLERATPRMTDGIATLCATLDRARGG